MNQSIKYFLLGLGVSLVVIASFFLGAIADRLFNIKPLDYLFSPRRISVSDQLNAYQPTNKTSLSALLEKSGPLSIPDVVDAVSNSVVTVSIKKKQRVIDPSSGFFSFGPFGIVPQFKEKIKEMQHDIGTGFVVDQSGLVVTNKHVVADVDAEYRVFDKDGNEHVVSKIYRDPVNDLAILKVEGLAAPPLALGDSSALRVGESVIAIGTALGEFRHTVTTGVISGLGRGITAGDGFSQFENLEGVIQTDAAINPGNSGGPLINDRGQVIGVNVAVSQSAENIGFAIPINVVKSSLDNFNQTGRFDRPQLGVHYQMIDEQTALINEVPQGAYIVEVVSNSIAEKAGLQPGDIIVSIDGKRLKDKGLAEILNKKKIGDKVTLRYFRDTEEKTIEVTL